jgi:DNA-binding HxlR family transcriptional regulator
MVRALSECQPDCPVAAAADVLDGKWTTLIFRELLGGTRRYSELQRALVGVTPRMLALRLSELEAAGLIAKTIYPTVPPRTEYRLTPLGEAAEPVIRAMARFGATLQANRQAADLPT